jgi:hypothetical protein
MRRPVVYYAFYCVPVWQKVYGVILAPLCAIALALPFMKFFHLWRRARVVLYILLAMGPLFMVRAGLGGNSRSLFLESL